MTTKDEVREGTEPREEKCTIEFARHMVKTGHLRGLVDCPIHGHHNPYHMYKTGEDMDAALPNKTVCSECQFEQGHSFECPHYDPKKFWRDFDIDKFLEDAKEVGEILRKSQEAALPKKEVWELKYCEDCEQMTNHKGDKCLKCPKKEGEGWDWEAGFDSDVGELLDGVYTSGGYDTEDIKAFIRQHFISRTAVEKKIEELRVKWDSHNGNRLLDELLEKINKE